MLGEQINIRPVKNGLKHHPKRMPPQLHIYPVFEAHSATQVCGGGDSSVVRAPDS